MNRLTSHIQLGKKCNDGKSRNFILFFLNDVQILKQKLPYEDDWERGFDKHTHFDDVYLLNGKIHQTRSKNLRWCGSPKYKFRNNKIRQVSFPVSKKKLNELGINPTQKIILS